jgi:hypothetical protein
VFGMMKRKRGERKLQIPMNELDQVELDQVNPSLFIGFRNFIIFLFISIKPNKP